VLAFTLTRACQLTHQEGKVILRLRIVDRRYQESGEAGLIT